MNGSIKVSSRALLLLLLASSLIQSAHSQDKTGSIAIGVQLSTPPPLVYNDSYIFGGVYISDPYSPIPARGSLEMPPDILISYWANDGLAFEPSIGIMAFTNETEWRLGLTIVQHFGVEKLRPFVSLSGKAYLSSTGSDLAYANTATKITNYFFGLGVGGEYFVGDRFSVSGQCQLNYLIPDKNALVYLASNTFSTGVGVAARFYLK